MHRTMLFSEIAEVAGFEAGLDGKFNLPATQETADLLARAATMLVGRWQPGQEVDTVTLTGPGPVWGYLAIAHALHGRVIKLTYAAPNATIDIWRHGA